MISPSTAMIRWSGCLRAAQTGCARKKGNSPFFHSEHNENALELLRDLSTRCASEWQPIHLKYGGQQGEKARNGFWEENGESIYPIIRQNQRTSRKKKP